MKKYIAIICKNCGKKTKTKIPNAELCSIPCIKQWSEEEEYAKVNQSNRTDHS